MYLKLYFLSIALLFLNASHAQTPEQSYFEWTTMPFEKDELAQRRTKLMSQLPQEGIAIIPSKDGFSNGETFRQTDNFYYFTGLELPNSILVLDLAENSGLIYVPERDMRFESSARPNDFPGMPLLRDTKIALNAGLSLQNIEDFPAYIKAMAVAKKRVFLDKGNKGSLVLEENTYITTLSPTQIMLQGLEKHRGLRFSNMYDAIAKVRMIKSSAEIELMRQATSINVEGIKAAAKTIKAGIDERYLEGILEGNYKVNGAQRLAFGSIIKSGPNSLWPWRILATHYDRRNRIMNNGELVIFDVGCEYKYYVSDVGRTFPVSGKFSERQRDILTMEVGIADQIIDFIRPGITFADIRTLTDKIIPSDAKKYMQVGLFFGHHLGLSTGDPNLPEARLRPGMIFTVEPWYYNHDEQLSVFTEDVILVTEDGCEVLSSGLARIPAELEKLMQN